MREIRRAAFGKRSVFGLRLKRTTGEQLGYSPAWALWNVDDRSEKEPRRPNDHRTRQSAANCPEVNTGVAPRERVAAMAEANGSPLASVKVKSFFEAPPAPPASTVVYDLDGNGLPPALG
uniref:Uncharacterized protein n=1 Tax=Trichuris muris TaxID=70415 RepID=A0A5S6QET8_TRIMR